MQPHLEFYRQLAGKESSHIASLKKKIAWVAVARLAAFIMIAVAIAIRMRSGDNLWFPATLLFIVVFFILLHRSANLGAAKRLAEKLLFINENEIAAAAGQPNSFSSGAALPQSAIYTDDLDVFGEGSVYHFINRTTTVNGALRLGHLLQHPFTDPAGITRQQEAAVQLARQVSGRQLITARGLLLQREEGSLANISDWIQAEGMVFGKSWLRIVRFVLPALNIAALFYYLSSNNPIPVGIGIIISWMITSYYIAYISRQHKLIGKKQTVLEQYASILNAFHETDPGNSAVLKRLSDVAGEGKSAIKKLSVLTNFFDQRLSLLVNFIMNSFVLYDVQCIIELEAWKQANREKYDAWVDAVAEIEVVNSLATFTYNHPHYTMPQVLTGSPQLRAVAMGHPLIRESASVPNNISAGTPEKLFLITGSNMSGKSTFLRTIGVNILLAQCGAPVCAGEFSFVPMKMLTSIRISDSLQENTSYFMAELKRLRQIITELETGSPALVLIDEVLRGTNSDDKTHGSEALIRRLIGFNCLTLFATHDLTLSMLENTYPDAMRNYCFESTIENGELLFDYRLRSGVATNKNATFLMQKMGIISA